MELSKQFKRCLFTVNSSAGGRPSLAFDPNYGSTRPPRTTEGIFSPPDVADLFTVNTLLPPVRLPPRTRPCKRPTKSPKDMSRQSNFFSAHPTPRDAVRRTARTSRPDPKDQKKAASFRTTPPQKIIPQQTSYQTMNRLISTTTRPNLNLPTTARHRGTR